MERASVRIYGHEYTVTGDKPSEYIKRVADFVDERMKQVAVNFPNGSTAELAALAAVNIADELFSAENGAAETKSRNEQLENDARHYNELWEETKRNFTQYKEQSERLQVEKEELQGRYNEAASEADKLRGTMRDLEERLATLERKNENLSARLQAQEDGRSGTEEQIKALENKNKEIESSFFDLQMENIQLKGEIERYKRVIE